MSHELETFLNTWDEEAKTTVAMLKALPTGQYDFRPDAGGVHWASWPGTWRKSTPIRASVLSAGRLR